jgi:hypothetical protein
MSSTKKQVVIPLNISTNATQNFNENNLIQSGAYKKIEYIIGKNLGIVKQNINSKTTDFTRFHEAITVLGNRGSGKTSFLLNLQSMLHEHSSLVFLQILDPTLFESKQHVLLTVISIILEKVEATETNDLNTDYETAYKSSLDKLADGINLLDGINDDINHKSVWDDARINFNKGIDSSSKGVSFEKDFRNFIANALKYMNKEMFILMFDDIDTNVEKGWPILEVIRKYLTILEIQVIVSGDWTLFSKLVRINQLKNLKGLQDIEEECDCRNRHNYLATLDVLEDQYLTKILKPENRILLQGLYALIDKIDLYVIKNSSDSQDTLSDNDKMENIYRKLFNYSLALNDKAAFNSFKKIFLTLPIRSNIQLLSSFMNKENYQEFVDSLGKQFLTQLTRYNITIQDLYDLRDVSFIYSYIKKAQEIEQSVQKIPFRNFLDLSTVELDEEQEKNVLFFVLKSHITAALNEHKFLLFDWMFRIELFKYYFKEPRISFEKDLRYLGFGLPTSAREFAQRLNGYVYYQESEKNNKNQEPEGFAAVFKDQSKKQEKSYQYLVKQLKEKDSSSLIILDLMFNQISLQRDSKSDLYGSVYFLLGAMGEILALPNDKKSISNYFINRAKIATIAPYSEKNITSTIYYSQESNINNLISEKFVNEFHEWHTSKDAIEKFPIAMLEATIKEFHFQELDMPYVDNFADYITLQSIYFLSALLKAEAKHIFEDELVTFKRIKNIGHAKNGFKSMLTKYNKHIAALSIKKFQLFDFIYACPVWKYIFDDESIDIVENIEQIESNNFGGLFQSLEQENDDDSQGTVNKQQPFMQLLAGLKTFGSDSKKKDLKQIEEIEKAEIDNEVEVENVSGHEKYSRDDFKYKLILQIFQENEEDLKDLRRSSREELEEEVENYQNYLKKYHFSIQRIRGQKRTDLIKAILDFNEID